LATSEKILNYIKELPTEPGVYRYFDSEDNLIYVGKAKKLKNRVSSYFQKTNQHSRKTLRLVSQIERIEYTVVDNEFDALLLENNLIKKNQPKYNILLKDDKTYPYIIITKQSFPRVESTRTLDRRRGEFFGPYSSISAQRTLLELIHKLYPIRICTLNLEPPNLAKGNFKVCLEYHIGNCKGPCEQHETELEYNEYIIAIREILKGNLKLPKDYLTQQMNFAASSLDFEKAQLFKQKLDYLENYQSKSIISNPKFGELDVITITRHEKKAFVNFLKIENGAITASKNIELRNTEESTDEELIIFTALDIRTQINSKAKEILTNIDVSEQLIEGTSFTNPIIGDKKRLTQLSLKNALVYKKEKSEITIKPNNQRVIETLQKDLRLQDLPKHIECFDNSNIQGTHPVASMVCFRMGKPSKKDYRHYNIKTVVGPDDFASMVEIVTRRYSRLMRENKALPDLIIVDGGKGQLSVAYQALRSLGIEKRIPIVGIAKRLEEIYYPGDTTPLYIDKKSESLKLIQQLRNEAHRFAITFHRQKRSNSFLISSLDNIKGIGPASRTQLLDAFKSVDKIRVATKRQLAEILGNAKAELIIKHYSKEK
jgi:excinuclease ABC subunit C